MPTDDQRRLDPTAETGAPGAATTFVPDPLDATKWSTIEPLYQDLLDRPVDTEADFKRWLLDRSELDSAAGESRANLYISMTCHTDDESISGAWSAYLDEVPPRLKPVAFALHKRQAELFEKFPLEPSRFEVLRRNTAREVELFRDENVPLETEIAKLDQRYDKICGEMSVEFEGETRTIAQMGKFLQDTDRARREAAWRAVGDRRLQDREPIEDIFDKMLELRQQMAANAGYDNYRDFEHDRKLRFDYTPEHCFAFHEGVEQHCVPFLRRLDERRRKALAVDALRPWDLLVDEKGRDPLSPFEDGQDLIGRSRKVFERLDPQLSGFFNELGDNMGPNLDLDSRKGKAFGGYQYMRDRSKMPFIFMNAAGLHRDVETMVHEAGHAFHSRLCAGEELLPLRDYAIEIAEVASMSMELLTMPYWDAYYPDASDAGRARRAQLEGSVKTLAWIATIDAFQHWLYTNKGHTRDERKAAWLDISRRFGHDVSWEGLEQHEAYQWQRQGHLFSVPFYYIEYGIAQLGALGVWLTSLEKGQAEALDLYKKAMTLGNKRPLPEIFNAAGLPFDFGPETIGRLVEAVEAELAKLPE
jgi:oligoendopeptidase F